MSIACISVPSEFVEAAILNVLKKLHVKLSLLWLECKVNYPTIALLFGKLSCVMINECA